MTWRERSTSPDMSDRSSGSGEASPTSPSSVDNGSYNRLGYRRLDGMESPHKRGYMGKYPGVRDPDIGSLTMEEVVGG